MAKDKLVEYDATAANNTVVGDVNLAENSCLPSDLNNAVREVMSHQKEAFGAGTPLYVDQTNNRVGIGTASVSTLLHLNSSSDPVIRLQRGGGAYSQIVSDSGGSLFLQADNGASGSSSRMQFNVDGSEKMRLDSGTLLVGKTAENVATVGIEARATGPLISTRDGADALRLNRLNSDGEIIQCRRDGVTIGSIFGYNGYLGIGGTGGNDAHIIMGYDVIAPATSTGAAKDSAIDLGDSGRKFKDGYFSGTLNCVQIRGVSDTNTGIDVTGSDIIGFKTGGSEKARIDQNGDVGIGTSSTGDARLHIVSSDTHQLKLQASNGNITRFQGDSFITTRNGDFFFDNRNQDTNNFQYRCGTTAAHIFSCGTSEKARVNTQSIIVGKTSNGSLSDAGSELNTSGYGMFSRSSGTVLFLNRNDTGASINFYRNSVQVGNISVDSSSTAFNTSSDRRLKSNIEDAASASDKIDAIQVRQFDWNADNSHQDYGLIAQELQLIEPMAVTGDENSDMMMGVDYSKLVPMLIKEIQELRGRVAALEAS